MTTGRDMIWTKKKLLKLCVVSSMCLVGLTVYFFASVAYQMKYGYLKDRNVLQDYWDTVGSKLLPLRGGQLQDIEHPESNRIVQQSPSPGALPQKPPNVTLHDILQQQQVNAFQVNGTPREYPRTNDGIPNIVHFVWITASKRSFFFTEMVSILSAHKQQQPERMFLHCNNEPAGKWWDELTDKFHVKIGIIKVQFPLPYGSTVINSTSLVSEIVRIHVLKEYGGMFIALDVIVVDKMDDLRVHQFVIGKSASDVLSPAVLLSAADSDFINALVSQMLQFVGTKNPKSIKLFNLISDLSRKFPKMVHMEKETLTFPEHTKLLYTDNHHVVYWRKYPVIHLHFHNLENKIYSPEYIKKLKNLIGQVLRLNYFGSADVEDKFLPHLLYNTGLTNKPVL